MKNVSTLVAALAAAIVAVSVSPIVGQAPGGGQAQGGRGGGRGQGGGGQQAQQNLPTAPTAVALPTLSAEITGPGPIFESAPSLPPDKTMAAMGYEAKEYFISGTANGQPYKTRIVV